MEFIVGIGLWAMLLIGATVLVVVSALAVDRAVAKLLKVFGGWFAVLEYFRYRKAFKAWMKGD